MKLPLLAALCGLALSSNVLAGTTCNMKHYVVNNTGQTIKIDGAPKYKMANSSWTTGAIVYFKSFSGDKADNTEQYVGKTKNYAGNCKNKRKFKLTAHCQGQDSAQEISGWKKDGGTSMTIKYIFESCPHVSDFKIDA